MEPVSQDPISSGASQLLKALQRPSGGGNIRLNRSSSAGNQSVFIYAVQPVETFVPFPYPISMGNESNTNTESSGQYQVSSIWRA